MKDLTSKSLKKKSTQSKDKR